MMSSHRAAALLIVASIASIYALPQVRYLIDGHHHGLIQRLDEAPYAARVQEVLDGHWRAADQYLWEHKSNPTVLPYGAELFLAGLATAFRLDVDQLIIAVRFIAPLLLAAVLYQFLRMLTSSVLWSAFGTAFILLEPGTLSCRPFLYVARILGLPDAIDLSLAYQRFHNPVVLAIPFVIAVTAFYRAVRLQRSRDVVLAGVALGINFYSQLFYWAYLYTGMLFFGAVHIREKQTRKVITGVLAVGTLCGSLVLFEQVRGLFAGPDRDVLIRAGLLLPTRSPLHLFPKGLMIASLITAAFYRPRDQKYDFFLSFLAGGYLLLNQNVITGREVQNYHFNYPNALMACAGLIMTGQNRFAASEARFGVRARRLGLVGVSVAVVWLVGNGLVLQARTYEQGMAATAVFEGGYPSLLTDRFEHTLAWIRANTPRDAVFLADHEISFLVPIYTSGNVLLNPLQRDHAGSLMTDDELFERWMVHLKLEGVTNQELFEMVRYRHDMSIVSWGFGRNSTLQQRYDFQELSAFVDAVRSDRLARDYVAEYARFPAADIAARLRKYRVDLLVVSGRHRRFGENASKYLSGRSMKVVGRIETEDVTVFAFDSH